MAKPPKKPRELVLVRTYIDALSLYYGVAKEDQFKWIDIKKLLRALIQLKFNKKKFRVEIEKIYLFTADVIGDAARSRQNVYLRALKEKYGDSLEIVKGKMISIEKRGMLDENGQERLVTVKAYEEKKTDVNLACRMVRDADIIAIRDVFKHEDFHLTCLVSNDSDLEAPLMIKKKLEQRIFLVFPLTEENENNAAKNLKQLVPGEDRIPYIPRKVLLDSRLPLQVGQRRCPEKWIEQDEEKRKSLGEDPRNARR